MASGYGLNGGPSRCFPFWQELLACYVINTSSEDVSGQAKCAPALEDYYECLHHRKELARAQAMQQAYQKYLLKNPRQNAPSAGEIRKLGLLDVPKEEKHIKGGKYLPESKYGNTIA